MYYDIRNKENREKIEEFMKREGIPVVRTQDSLVFFLREEAERIGREKVFSLFETSMELLGTKEQADIMKEEFPKVLEEYKATGINQFNRKNLLQGLRLHLENSIHAAFVKRLKEKGL